MSMECQGVYPGEGATAAWILLLADEYRRSADELLTPVVVAARLPAQADARDPKD